MSLSRQTLRTVDLNSLPRRSTRLRRGDSIGACRNGSKLLAAAPAVSRRQLQLRVVAVTGYPRYPVMSRIRSASVRVNTHTVPVDDSFVIALFARTTPAWAWLIFDVPGGSPHGYKVA